VTRSVAKGNATPGFVAHSSPQSQRYLPFDEVNEPQRIRYYRTTQGSGCEDHVWGVYNEPLKVRFTVKQLFSLDHRFVMWLQGKLCAVGLEGFSTLKTAFPWAFYTFPLHTGRAFPGRDYDSREVGGEGDCTGTPYENSQEFVVWQGAELDKIKEVLRMKFWMFATSEGWPKYATVRRVASDGERSELQHIPFELITTNPELFTEQYYHREEPSAVEDPRQQGTPAASASSFQFELMLHPAQLNGNFFHSTGHKYAESLWAKLKGVVASLWQTWLGAFFVVSVFIELLGVASRLFSVKSLPALMVVKWPHVLVTDDVLRTTLHSMIATPLRDLYRHGPHFATPAGTFGFWGSRPLTEICALMTSLKVEYWETNLKECESIYMEKEAAFISFFSFVTILSLGYVLLKVAWRKVEKL